MGDPRKGSWIYQSSEANTAVLKFSSDPQDSQNPQILRVALKSIIGVWSPEQDEDNDAKVDLLYVEENQDSTSSVPRISHISASALPRDILRDMSAPTSWKSLLGRWNYISSSEPEVAVIISTESGSKSAGKYYEEALKPILSRLGPDNGHTVYTTTSADTISDLTRNTFLPKANEGKVQILILLSGDGGTIDVVNTLYSSQRSLDYWPPVLMTLPLGTGNALSNSYKYNQDDTFGLSTVVRSMIRFLPAFRVTFSPGARMLVNEGREERELSDNDGTPTMHGVVVCSWGLHASLVADSDTAHYRQFGAQRFQIVAKQLLQPEDGSQHHAYKGTVSVKDFVTGEWFAIDRETHSYILATLVSNLERTFVISPDSKALDGELRLIEMPAMSGEDLTKVMGAAYQDGKHIGMPGVGYREIDGLRIDFDEEEDRWRRVCIDGKIVKVEKGGWMCVEKEADSVVDIVCRPEDTT